VRESRTSPVAPADALDAQRAHTGLVATPHTSAAFSATLRVHLDNRPGAFARMASVIGEAGGSLDAIDLVRVEHGKKVRDVTVLAIDEAHIARITENVSAQDGIEVEQVSDRTLLLHRGGKLEIASRVPLKTRDDLSMAYTPGVARACTAIADDPESVWSLTTKANSVAIVTDGTAVLGLGDIGPEAALPVMEGKAILFKEFGGIDAWPICLATTDPDEIVRTVTAIAPGFGGINLEDIAAPRCFEIEARLRETLEIPVFHDDQHGTAIVVLAALQNALRVVGKRLEDVHIVVTGAGAAGTATARMLASAGAGEIICSDRGGVLYAGRPGLNSFNAVLAEDTNPRGLRGSADDALVAADVYIGLSGPGAVSVEGIRAMANDAIVFVMANPTPEVAPEAIEDLVAVLGTGRSDYPNQINNVLVFPGLFRGALDVRATAITEGMKLAAARALADVVPPDHLEADYVLPSVLDREVAPAIARAVARAAISDGVAGLRRDESAIASVTGT
jgi:malate dehydrogenase (oxaloacetate-decarboxylating)